MGLKNKNDLQIVSNDEKEVKTVNRKTNVIIAASLCGLLAVGGGVFAFVNANKIDPKDQEAYEKVAKEYEKHDIEYSYEDYLKDKAADEELKKKAEEAKTEEEKNKILNSENGGAVSNARNELADSNQTILDNISESKGEDEFGIEQPGNGVDTTVENIKNLIINNTKIYNKYIYDDNFGWPPSQYPEEDYKFATEYNEGILDYMSGKPNEIGDPIEYMGVSVKDQCRFMRYAIYHQIPYTINPANKGFDTTLSGYIKSGYPLINSIYSISITQDEKEFDNEISELRCFIETNAGNFNAYLVSHNSEEYVLLDIVKA